ncbi:hypothetical protein [uncultured Ruegeria sp.]|uniref:hypothetical protein n=1 Tax=uncultured Ruegeria sp. TaxID=259304 RepID=UPI0026045774|nr:hypothetical protein [uncultured Ruegeria sp.]
MKKWMCVAVTALLATAAAAEERRFVCVSDRDGSEVRLNQAAEGDKGRIATQSIEGDATILKGVGNMTFLHIEGGNVVTFVIHTEDMTYDLSIKGPHVGTDRGTCIQVDA